MGKLGRRLLDFVRAGALAAGAAALLGVWFQGMARLGFREVFPDGLADVLAIAVTGLLLGVGLGFPSPPVGRPALVGRFAGTAVMGMAIGAALVGITFLLAKVLDVPERKFPVYFVVMGLALVGVGLRRLPRGTPARVALAVPVALLVVSRLMVLWPDGAHAITRRIFPLPAAIVRSELERLGWGQLAIDQRTRVVTLETSPSYHTESSYLLSDSTLRFTLEAVRPFHEDACGDLHSEPPVVPAFVRAYPTREACEKEHPARNEVRFEMFQHQPSPCCVFETKERHPGEQFHATRKWEFVFKNLVWRAAR
jgi:hypothetical protein